MSATRASHIEYLRENVFQTETKWPHFNRLLEDLDALAMKTPTGAHVVILERAYVYGGLSLFAPLFDKQKVTVVDCHIESTKERGGYQASWTDDPRCVKVKATQAASITATNLSDACADVLLIPNVVHHVADQDGMYREAARLLKPSGTGYIFEALLRELHQSPDDYVRYTPWGFEQVFKKAGMKLTEWKPAGGPFEAIAYCWVQALQYIPEDERREKEDWFYRKHFKELLEMDRKYPQNLFRKHTSFPVGYSIYFEKQ